MNEADYRDGLDGLCADMAAHQRNHVGEVTASANQALASETIARLEREQAEAKPVPAEANHALPVKSGGVTTERREGKHGSYLLSKSPTDNAQFRSATPAEHWFMTHAMPRVDLLMTKVETGPLGAASWNQRTMAVMELQSRVAGLKARGLHQSAADITRRFMFELVELLEASSVVFGDWKADAPARNPLIGWTKGI